VLTAGALLLCVAAIWLFSLRNVGAPALDLKSASGLRLTSPTPHWTLGGLYARSLNYFGLIAFWSTVVLALYMVLLISVTKQAEGLLTEYYKSIGLSSIVQSLLGQHSGDTAFLNLEFSFLIVFPVVVAIMLVARWAAEEGEGRLELTLAAPRSRRRVILASFAAFATALWVSLGTIFMVAWISIKVAGLSTDMGYLAQAVGGMLPLSLVAGAVGYMLTGWLSSRWVIGLLTLLVVGSFFITTLPASLHVPKWITHLSVFTAYGSPLIDGLNWGATGVLLGAAGLALALATWRFGQKDL
jgi:putative exporter of polyketide antibiotics